MADLEPGSDPAAASTPDGASTPPAIPPPAIPPAAIPPPIPPPAALDGGASTLPEEPKKKRRFGLPLALAGGLLGFLAYKFLLPLVIVGVAGQALGLAFGGPFERLPSDVQQTLEKRFEAAVGTQLDGLSDEAQGDRVEALVKGGLPRLDDTALVSHLQLASSAFHKAETGACATLARSILTGTVPPEDANTKVIGALSDSELQLWFELQVQALEAETRGSPAASVIDDATMDPYFEPVFAALSAGDVATLTTLSTGGTVDDAAACSALRGFYAATINRPPAEVALFARYDVSP